MQKHCLLYKFNITCYFNNEFKKKKMNSILGIIQMLLINYCGFGMHSTGFLPLNVRKTYEKLNILYIKRANSLVKQN